MRYVNMAILLFIGGRHGNLIVPLTFCPPKGRLKEYLSLPAFVQLRPGPCHLLAAAERDDSFPLYPLAVPSCPGGGRRRDDDLFYSDGRFCQSCP